MKTGGTTKAPKHLKPATRRWFEAVIAGWSLEEHHVRMLVLACEAWDRCAEARTVIARDGLTVATKDGGMKLHPAARIEDASRTAFARLLRELDLDIEPPAATRRPPALRSMRGGGDAA